MNTRALRLLALASFFVLALAPSSSWAQGTTGTVDGRVVDEQGLSVPGAVVTAQNAATGFTRSTVSDSTGSYRLPALPNGTYDVRVEMSGFAASCAFHRNEHFGAEGAI